MPTLQTKPRRAAKAFRGFAAAALSGLLAWGVYASTGGPLAETGEERAMTEAVAEPLQKILDPAEVIDLRPRDLTESLRISGVAEPIREVVVAAEVAGIAGEVRLRPGQTVRAGEPLLTIAEEDYQLALRAEEAARASLHAQLAAAESSLRRSTELAARGVVTTSALEDAQSSVAVLRANIEASDTQIRLARANLERAKVRAPISGVVVSRTVDPGQLVQPGTQLFEIIDLSRVIIEAMVPLDRMLMLSEGQKAEVWLPQGGSQTFAASIERISPRAVDGTRSALVYLGIDNVDPSLPAGLFLTGRIILRESAGALAVPSAAVSREGGRASVQVVQDGHLTERSVSVGAAWPDGDLVEITAGLAAGDRVLAMPLRNLAPGEPVRIAER